MRVDRRRQGYQLVSGVDGTEEQKPKISLLSDISRERSLSLWRGAMLILVSLCLGVYFLLICIKLDDRSVFDHYYIFYVCAGGHLAAFVFLGIHIVSPQFTSQQKMTSVVGLFVVVGSFTTQLLLVLRLDLIITTTPYVLLALPFVVSLAMMIMAFIIIDPSWYMHERTLAARMNR